MRLWHQIVCGLRTKAQWVSRIKSQNAKKNWSIFSIQNWNVEELTLMVAFVLIWALTYKSHLKFHNDRRDGKKREWEWIFSGCVPREPFFVVFFCLPLYFVEPLFSFSHAQLFDLCVLWTKKRYLWEAPHFYISTWWFDLQNLMLRWTVDEKKSTKRCLVNNGTRSTLFYSICSL